MDNWFIPVREEFQSQRALLHLGLNKATRYYRELIVPDIAGVLFVRQLSWAVAGIAIAKELRIKPAKIANGIEALACKLEYRSDKDNFNKKGIRAFERDKEDNVWSFNDLSNKKYYVQVTYRQSTVRALAGLKLTTGTRFNIMELTKIGDDIKEAFLNQKKIRGALFDWLKGEAIPKTAFITEGIGSVATLEEKEIIRDRLRADSSDTLANTQRRNLLIEAFGRNTANMPGLDVIKKSLRQTQVNDIETAIAFDEMVECGRTIVYICAKLIAEKETSLISKLIQKKELSNALDALCKAADKFQQAEGEKHEDASKFAIEILLPSVGNMERLKSVIQRDKNILMVNNEKIIEGHLFDRRKESDEDGKVLGTEESSTENKIRQLFGLWSDCK